MCLTSIKTPEKLTALYLLFRARVRKRAPAHISLVKNSPLDGASVLACAYQLKIRSKNPTDFEYWFCQQTMSKIRNDFIKQHQRRRWRYLSLLAQSVGARFPAPTSQGVLNFTKKTTLCSSCTKLKLRSLSLSKCK